METNQSSDGIDQHDLLINSEPISTISQPSNDTNSLENEQVASNETNSLENEQISSNQANSYKIMDTTSNHSFNEDQIIDDTEITDDFLFNNEPSKRLNSSEVYSRPFSSENQNSSNIGEAVSPTNSLESAPVEIPSASSSNSQDRQTSDNFDPNSRDQSIEHVDNFIEGNEKFKELQRSKQGTNDEKFQNKLRKISGIKSKERTNTRSKNSNSVQLIDKVVRSASPISKRLRHRSPKHIEDSYDSDCRLSPSRTLPINAYTKKNSKPKTSNKLLKKGRKPKLPKSLPNQSKSSNSFNNAKIKNLPSTSSANDFLDLYLENEESMDEKSLIKNLRLQIKQTKWENLKLREQNADLIDENERMHSQITYLERQNNHNKTEIFNLQVENHKLNKQNVEFQQKNADLQRDNMSKARMQEITKEELIRVRTDKLLKANNPKISPVINSQTKTPTPKAPARRMALPIKNVPAQGYRFLGPAYRPIDWKFVNKKKLETQNSQNANQPSTSKESQKNPEIVNLE